MRKIVLHFFFVLAALLMVNEGFAQSRKVTGRVADGDGYPLPGASVLIKGTQEGVGTDLDGNFSINVKDDNAVLVFSFVGMNSVEKKVGKANVLNVVLKEDSTLEEINIVTTGYESVNKRTFTGAVSRISEKELKVDGVPDVSRMIEGKAAGVTVQNVTGTFGAAPKITVRGSSSIFGDTKPLWVIDGMVQEEIINVSFEDLASGNASTMLSSAVAGLNASDVLSIEILKDAAATSIYGARAMNGVVVITTKSGRKNTPLTVTYNMENTIREIPRYGSFDILNSQATMGILSEMEGKGLLTDPSISQGRYGGVYNLWFKSYNVYNPQGGEDHKGGYDRINTPGDKYDFLRQYEYANTDWFKELFRPSIMQNHSLSFTGGSENATYYASVGYMKDPGWTIADQVQRITANLKTTFYFNDRMNLGLSTVFSSRKQDAPGSFDRQDDPVGGSVSRDFDINPFNYALNTSRALRPYDNDGFYETYRQNWAPFNILNELDNNNMTLDVKDIKLQADFEYKLMDGLKFNSSAALRYVISDRDHDVREGSNVVQAFRAAETTVVKDQNIYLYQDPDHLDGEKEVVLKDGGIWYRYQNKMTAINWRNSFSYDKIFGKNGQHEINAFAGSEIRVIDRDFSAQDTYGIMYDNGYLGNPNHKLYRKLFAEGDALFKRGYEKERNVGFFARVNYTYDGKYTASLTGRYDASNQQGQSGAMWLPTWTASGKWNIIQEEWMMNQNTFSDLSLRGSYGLTATAGPASNSSAVFKNALTVSRFDPNTREVGMQIENLKNGDLTWEKQYEANIGLDMGLFKNRIYLSTDIYQRQAFDLVDQVRTSGIGGETYKWGNNADMTTKGVELSLTTRNIDTKSFKWTSNLNVSYYDQKIKKLSYTPRAFDLIAKTGGNVVGKPRNVLYSYEFTGLNSEGLPTYVMADGETDNVGGANFQDTQDVVSYLKYEGTVEPNKTIGFNNTFQYENWSLDVMTVAAWGNVVRLDPNFSSQYNDTQIFTKAMNNRWVIAGDENTTNVPVIASADMIDKYGRSLDRAYNTYNYSDQRIAKGDFIRIKNITLGYEFPELVKKQMRVSSFGVKLSVTNPFLLYSDKKLNGQDPEFFRVGGVAMPVTRQYTLTLNLSI
ncbi:SusC/RagA family TonB-linked outer membrane protein [Myroides odoratus]|uniref:SusC/RagA family TonB-linked outer membrane protein n=1 Tax=Myroides odoratus TaxID=256 RepID=UPI003342C80B